MAITLKRAKIETFVIFDKAAGVGGVWRTNTYPGAGCDVESHFYSFSFAFKKDWGRPFAKQPQILKYLEDCVNDFGLTKHLRLNTQIADAEWHEATHKWHLYLADGTVQEVDIVVSAVGIFGEPSYSSLAGLSRFSGEMFHSSSWDNSVDLAGKNVGLIGTGSSAVQFVPEIVGLVDRLNVFQREPGWVVPKRDGPHSRRQRWIYAHVPLAARLNRWKLLLRSERGTVRLPSGRAFNKRQRLAQDHLNQSVGSANLRKLLQPNYPVACKRMLRSNEYYESLSQPGVSLISTPTLEITDAGVRSSDGREYPCDVLILATGFKATDYLESLRVAGRNSAKLREEWDAHGTRAYLGMAVAGFPNFFIMYGPNTNAQVSILYMIELQARYIRKAIRQLVLSQYTSMEVRGLAMERHEGMIQRAMQGSVWFGGCGT